MDCFASLAMTANTPSRSRGSICPRLAIEFPYPPVRGRRECRVRAAPAVSCAKVCKKAHTSIQVQRRHPTFPAQWFYGLYRALVSAKSARMCERAVLTNRPSLDLSPIALKGLESLSGSEGQIRCLPQPEQLHGL